MLERCERNDAELHVSQPICEFMEDKNSNARTRIMVTFGSSSAFR